MRWGLALGFLLLGSHAGRADTAESEAFRECIQRRVALTKEAELEEDADMRAQVLAHLPNCVRTVADVARLSFDDCREQRRVAVAEAMTIADPHQRGDALAKIPVCRRDEDGSTTVEDRSTPPAPPPPPEPASPIPIPNALELAVTLGLNAWSGAFEVPGGSGPLLGVEAGAHWSEASVLAFWNRTSFDGSVTYSRESGGVQIPTMFQFQERLWVVGARGRGHVGRFSIGLGGGYGHREANGTSATASFHTNDDLAVIDADIVFACLAIGRFRLEILAGAGLATSSNETTTSARIGIAARL